MGRPMNESKCLGSPEESSTSPAKSGRGVIKQLEMANISHCSEDCAKGQNLKY